MPFYPVTQDPQQVLLSQVRGAFVRYDPPASLIAMVDPGSVLVGGSVLAGPRAAARSGRPDDGRDQGQTGPSRVGTFGRAGRERCRGRLGYSSDDLAAP